MNSKIKRLQKGNVGIAFLFVSMLGGLACEKEFGGVALGPGSVGNEISSALLSVSPGKFLMLWYPTTLSIVRNDIPVGVPTSLTFRDSEARLLHVSGDRRQSQISGMIDVAAIQAIFRLFLEHDYGTHIESVAEFVTSTSGADVVEVCVSVSQSSESERPSIPGPYMRVVCLSTPLGSGSILRGAMTEMTPDFQYAMSHIEPVRAIATPGGDGRPEGTQIF